MYLISLGYPIGVKNNGFVIEADGTQKAVTSDEALLWMRHNGVNKLSVDIEMFNRLIYLGVLCCGENLEEIYKKTASYHLVRQGCGSVKNNKHALYLGDDVFFPTEVQHDIWKLANSKRTLSEIWMMIKSKHGDILSIESLFESINALMIKNLIFII